MKSAAHLYRFAMFGRSDSGKTCILTALSMSHKANPLGHSVTWVPDPPEADTADADAALAYREGKAALVRARNAMERGEKPPPSPLRILRYRFDFTAVKPQPRTYKVELSDYSGELIDPRMNAEGLAKKLRHLLGSMDGLFVLAEAPRLGAERNRLPREFELLQQAFAVLAAEKEKRKVAAHTPVVLMLNKWDRRHPRPATPGQRAAEMDEFLHGDPEPPHLALTHFLEGAVAEGCYHAVPVSAFGAARIETQTDQDGVARQVELPPTEFPLPSFGLEDGFVWAARVRDEQDVAAFERTAAGLSYAKLIPWFGLNALNPFGAAAVRREGGELAARFPASSEMHKRARAGAGKATRVAALRSMSLAVLLVALLFGGEATLDVARYRRAEADATREDLQFADVERHLQFLRAYNTSPAYRHFGSRFLVGREEAKSLHDRMYAFHDQRLAKKIESLPGPLAQEDSAAEYVRLFPSGAFAAQAGQILAQATTLRCVAANQKHLDDAKAAADGLHARLKGQNVVSRADVTALERQVSAVPHVEQLTEQQKTALADLRGQAVELNQVVSAREGERGVADAIKRGNFTEAGNTLRRMKDEKVAVDVEKLVSDAVAEAQKSADAALGETRWKDAVKIAKDVKDGLGSRLLSVEQDNQVAGWADRAHRGWHAALYAEVYRNDGSESFCRRYLNDTQVPQDYKKRKTEVQATLDYHDQMRKSQRLTFAVKELSINRTWYDSEAYCLYVYVGSNSENVCAVTGKSASVGWKHGATVSVGASGTATATPIGSVSLKIEFGNKKEYTELGKFSGTVQVAELANEGKWIELEKGKYSKDGPSKVRLVVTGLPSKPYLPSSAE